uniref:Uncharacterized protein n=1 Tax=Quercus lobata TaxID=97700 RepID=A0A7N2N2D9_QUELO
MHRSSSTSRVSSELFSSQSQSQTYSASSSDNDQQEEQEQELLLPTYDPLSHVAKKQLSRLRSAQSAVHLIPLVLLLCAIILWFFSTPDFVIVVVVVVDGAAVYMTPLFHKFAKSYYIVEAIPVLSLQVAHGDVELKG